MEDSVQADAQAYHELSTPQVESGSKFIRQLSLSQGDKVIDMGCGTGILTKYITDIVGPNGQVVGIDPDAARVKIAKEKYHEIGNLQFHVGNSVTGFPYDNEPYYDGHISSYVFHWLPNHEKKVYIQKAHQCLNPGGKLGIFCMEKMLDTQTVTGFNPLTQDGYRKLFQDVGSFPNVVINKLVYPLKFESFEELKNWFKASVHQSLDEVDPMYVTKFVTKEESGCCIVRIPFICITASKI